MASTSQTHQYYQETLNGPALFHRRVSGVLKELEVMNLIGGTKRFKEERGRSSEVWLKVPARAVLDYFDPRLKEKLSSIKEARDRFLF